MNKRTPHIRLLIALGAVLLLPACETAVFSAASYGVQQLNFFRNPDVNLVAKNYAAADYIIHQAETFIDDGDRLQMRPLVNFEEPKTPAPIGSLIPEQIGARLTQLGYNVDIEPVISNTEALAMSGGMVEPRNPDFTLGGHYMRDKLDMNVSLRIVEVKTGRVVGAFDYAMPTNTEIRELSKPKAQIMRIPE